MDAKRSLAQIGIGVAVGAVGAVLWQRPAMRRLSHNERFGMLSKTGMEVYMHDYASRAAVDVLFADGDQFKALNEAGRLLGYADVYEFPDRLVKLAFAALRASDKIIQVGQKNSGDEWIVIVPAGTGRGAATRLLATMRDVPTAAERDAIRSASGGTMTTFSATIAVVPNVVGRAAIRAAVSTGILAVNEAKAAGRRGEIVT